MSNALVRRVPETEVSPIPTQKPSDSSPVTVRRRSKSGPKDSLPRFSISVEDESVMFQQKGKHAVLHNLGDGCFLSRWPCRVLFKLRRNFQCRGTLTRAIGDKPKVQSVLLC